MSELILAELAPAMLPELSEIMRHAFNVDSQFHRGIDDGPPGYDDGSFLEKWSSDPHCVSLAVLQQDKPVGAVLLWPQIAPGEGQLGCLFVDAGLQGQGIGQKVWALVEARYPLTRTWRTETPAYSFRNHCFYINKLGFHVTQVSQVHDLNEAMFHLTKIKD